MNPYCTYICYENVTVYCYNHYCFGWKFWCSTRFLFPLTYQEVHLLIYLIRSGISRSFIEPPETRQRDLAVVGFTPSINSWEIVQLIKMITTQLLPAAGLLPFVFTRSCEVKGVGESCRYVWLAVWISGIRYPKAFFLYYLLSSEKLKEGEKFRKITLHHLIWRRRAAANTGSMRASVNFTFFFFVCSVSSHCFWLIWNELCFDFTSWTA